MFAKIAVPVPLTPLDLRVDYKIPADLNVRAGHLVDLTFGRQKTWGVVFDRTESSEVPEGKLKFLSKIKIEAPVFDEPKLKLLEWMSKHYFYPLGEVCEAAIPAAIRNGTEKTLSSKKEPASQSASPEAPKLLNAAQKEAVDKILSSDSHSHLLWGVTGSGKTEVYLQVISEILSRGKSALVLVPEISLTPQLTDRFERRFPGEVAIFHSGLKPKQIREAWLATHQGKKRIAIGPRSALFAPLQNLGVVIVDEEHDGSYKQEDRLRYNARDCALKLGELGHVPVVLGSATPSAESLHDMTTGSLLCSRLPARAVELSALPTIEIVDLKKGISVSTKTPVKESSDEFQIPQIKGDFFLSSELRGELEAVLASKKQAILFLNRRGLGSQEICLSCGHTPQCLNCEVSLTPHLKGLSCHYCGFETATLATCPDCGASERPFLQVGVGTEAIEKALQFHFPQARILRLDRDTVSGAAEYEEVLGKFRAGEADVLVGTQMVAKGHDFPDVTLVGILLAEMGLSVPDYRANERCFQLLLQVSGRAGRGLHPGKVLLQTFQPEHPVLQSLLMQQGLDDYARFMESELFRRKAHAYPPYGHLTLLRFDGLDAGDVRTAAETVAKGLKKIPQSGLTVLGPSVSPLAKIRGRHRWQLLVKSDQLERTQKAISWILDGWVQGKLEAKYRARLLIDSDPVNML